MDALQTVFETILKVLDMIKGFFNQLFPKKEDEETTEPEA